MARDRGMLFIFDADGMPGFWMRGMLFPLDMVWLDAEGVVVSVTASVPPASGGNQPPVYYPPRPIRFVLEINAGMSQELGIAPGSGATFLGIPLAGKS